jgi:hypothetical protein
MPRVIDGFGSDDGHRRAAPPSAARHAPDAVQRGLAVRRARPDAPGRVGLVAAEVARLHREPAAVSGENVRIKNTYGAGRPGRRRGVARRSIHGGSKPSPTRPCRYTPRPGAPVSAGRRPSLATITSRRTGRAARTRWPRPGRPDDGYPPSPPVELLAQTER